MGGHLPAALAAARNAIRSAVPRGASVLVACSGGADSLALATSAAFLARKGYLDAGAVIVDHGLQEQSAATAARAAAQCRTLGLDPVIIERAGECSGTEAEARFERYLAFERALEATGAGHVLLGHTLDDQAEQVLLGLARGSGTRSLAGMPAVRGPYVRPLLGLRRADTEAICHHESLEYWQDPTNAERLALRNRIRLDLLPAMDAMLGPGLASALARTADLAGTDADYLDGLAAAELAKLAVQTGPDALELELPALRAVPEALLGRVLRMAVASLGAGAPGFERLLALRLLVAGSDSAGPIQLAGHVTATRLGAARGRKITVLHLGRTPIKTPSGEN
ncbi:tRNA lysidine(34) synthetase TilS [Paeniglutamicibacter cryotolerans]|uniref:tRNA(Ile)-lysidine synthase n=1 Tax=Paeniglutamicibacter cryotolerans TaxID=670079 RepID=A0A839QH02_9MICC|nr:tRNA lysidine(34) synthetase TilS [Paeniglutamicibacter cryotolerans]MBB2995007.1 tRNA(Ile)-lysidine synthase [Paeniglutamicibacter cryotolerans]